MQAAPQPDNCFNVLLLVLCLGRFRFCFWALAWFCFWALAWFLLLGPGQESPRSPQDAPRGPHEAQKRPQEAQKRSQEAPKRPQLSNCLDIVILIILRFISSSSSSSAPGISEPRVARMSQATVTGPPWGRALPRSELRECLRRKWSDHLSSGHLGTQNSEHVSGKTGLTDMGHGISEVRIARMSQAKVTVPPQLSSSRNRAFPRSEVRGCLRRKWPDHHGAGHLRG